MQPFVVIGAGAGAAVGGCVGGRVGVGLFAPRVGGAVGMGAGASVGAGGQVVFGAHVPQELPQELGSSTKHHSPPESPSGLQQ